MDPSPPLSAAGTVNLYTKDFFALCRAHLNDNGIMCLWIPPASLSEVAMILKTFYVVFPNTYVYKGPGYPGIYLLGTNGEGAPRPNRFIQANEDKDIVADLNEWDNLVPSPGAILNLLVLTPDQLAVFVKDFRVITDGFPYTEFPLWRSYFDQSYSVMLSGEALERWRRLVFKE